MRTATGLQCSTAISCIACTLFAVSCTPIVSVKQARPNLAVHGGTGAQAIKRAAALAREAPITSLGEYLTIARASSAFLRERPEDGARAQYNFAVGRVIEIIQQQNLDPWHRMLQAGEYTLTGAKKQGHERNPLEYQLTPTDRLSIGGTFFRTRAKIDGLGAPLVAIGRGETSNYRQNFNMKRVYAALTAVIRFSGHRAEIELVEPLLTERITFNGHTYQLAADFSAPMALFMERERPQRYGFIRVFRPERYRDTATLVRLQAYSTDRTPVVFIHGLQDTAVTWVPMINGLLTDPAIRRQYQFWVFSYPSGYPFSYSAALLRKELDAVNKAFPDHQRIILVGHSMGGLVARLMVTDSGDRLWRAAFGASLQTTRAAGRSRQLAEDSLIFNHRPEVQRVVFISTPHRGSEIASSWIGRLAAKFVQMPEFVSTVRDAVLAIASADRAALLLANIPNSINTLSPKHWFLRELNDLPITRGVPYHSIIGDRGRGDTPNSSDGVVAYSSSHLDGATSEAIVPSDHKAHRNPKGIAETLRILKTSR